MKTKNLTYFLLSLCICSLSPLYSQNIIPTNKDLSISLVPEESNGMLIARGIVNNNTSHEFNLNYKLSVLHKNDNFSKNEQEGEFLLKPRDQVVIGQVKCMVHTNSIYQIKFEVFHDTTLISYMQYSNELDKTRTYLGLLMDNSKTKNGHIFFELFNNKWMSAEIETDATIYVVEKPMRLRSTLISIYINDLIIYQNRLQTTYDNIEIQANEAYNRISELIQRNPQFQEQQNDPDRLGNGI